MDTAAFLNKSRETIVGEAEASLEARHVRHYEAVRGQELRERLDRLFDRLIESVEDRDLTPILRYTRELAEERFKGGYGLSEVQAAFNVLEESVWSHVLASLDPSEFAEALGLVSSALGAAKDNLGRTYVSLATDSHAPSLNVRRLFAGSEGT
ncbi:MAG TPA: hypothetical protein VEM41_10335 [Actinomycetota bacterium]|nr:hypothetical protein [Actinomycetota bacterium]